MKRRILIGLMCASGVAASIPFSAYAKAGKSNPNVVVILADDMGYGDAGCYNQDSKIPTPHLDQMAVEGMRFTDAHAPSAVCSPTRYGLLTGRYAWRTEMKKGVLGAWDPPLIETDRLTLAAMLNQHDYHTACIGKWHLGWEWKTAEGAALEIGEKGPILLAALMNVLHGSFGRAWQHLGLIPAWGGRPIGRSMPN